MAAAASAQVYPSRPVTLIVPFPAGGGVDAMARITAERLTAAFGQQVVIDNRGGAAGVIGTRAAATANPDGYTLVISTSGTTSINPSLYANPGYDTLKDFTPIGLVASTPIVVMAHPSFRATSISELIAFARTQEHFDVGTPPPGTENNLAAELFKSMTGINMTIVSYKGTGPLTNDLVGGHIPVAFNTNARCARQPPVKASARSSGAGANLYQSCCPMCRPSASSRAPGFEATVRYGVLAPIGTPRPIIDRINSELRPTV